MTGRAPNPAADDLASALSKSPDIYLQKLDLVRLNALFIRFSEADYRAASFLDDRILSPATRGSWLSFDRAAALRHAPSPRPVHFVLHTGHVGSTLVSRLLDESREILSLREPLPLRTLAEAHDVVGLPESLLSSAQFETIVDLVLASWRRGYASTKCVVVKATSSAARVAPALLRRSDTSGVLYLSLRAEPYLTALLAGPNSWQDLRGHAVERMRRLRSLVAAPIAPLHAMSLGELAAMSWLVETLTRTQIAEQFPLRTLALDFDAFLADVTNTLARIFAHFGIAMEQAALERIVASPVLGQYSKAPEHEFNPALRAEIMRDARRQHGVEINRGLKWLETMARSESSVACALET
jgi:hypothetical protein